MIRDSLRFMLIAVTAAILSACLSGTDGDSGSGGFMTAKFDGQAWRATRGVIWGETIDGEGISILGKGPLSAEELLFEVESSAVGAALIAYGEYYSDASDSYEFASGSMTITQSGAKFVEGTFSATMVREIPVDTIVITEGRFKAVRVEAGD